MLIVETVEAEVESGLRTGLLACPSCAGVLGPWGFARRRALRVRSGALRSLRPRRARCRGCARTHALLPSFVVPRRLDAAPVIGAALEQAAEGRGHRPLAALLGLPATTVRGWLRRARTQAALLASRLWRLAQELGALAPRAPPHDRPLAALVRAVEAAHAAAARRLGEALWRYGLIREAAEQRLSPRERGQLVRALAGRPVAHPCGELRAPARTTLDDWIRAYRRGGFEALKPAERCPGPRTPAPLLEQAAALRRELPARTGAQIAEILHRLHGEAAPSVRTVERYLRRQGLSRARLQGGDRAYGRFEASAPNELWVADVRHHNRHG